MANKGFKISRRAFVGWGVAAMTTPFLPNGGATTVSGVKKIFPSLTAEHSSGIRWITGNSPYGYYKQAQGAKIYGVPSLKEVLRPVTEGVTPEIIADPFSVPDYAYLLEIPTNDVPDIDVGQIFADESRDVFKDREIINYYDSYGEVTEEDVLSVEKYFQDKIERWRACVEGFANRNSNYDVEQILDMKLKDFYDDIIKPQIKVALRESLKSVLNFPDLNRVSSRWSKNNMSAERLKSIVPDMVEKIDEIYKVLDLPSKVLQKRHFQKEIENGNYTFRYVGKKGALYQYELHNKSESHLSANNIREWLGGQIPFISEAKIDSTSNYSERKDNGETFSIETDSYVLNRVLDSLTKNKRYYDETPLVRMSPAPKF